MRTCIKCGGSWTGREFDTLCVHDFDEAPEPEVTRRGPNARGEELWSARLPDGMVPASHPTREGAIAAWKAEWRRRRDEQRAAEQKPATEQTPAEQQVAEPSRLRAWRAVCEPFPVGTRVLYACMNGKNYRGAVEDFDGDLRLVRWDNGSRSKVHFSNLRGGPWARADLVRAQ